jgi:hypothetical protein
MESSKGKKTIQKNQTNILDLKNTMNEVRNYVARFNSTFDQIE